MSDANKLVYVNSLDEIKLLKKGTLYTFDCRRCGKKVIRPKRLGKCNQLKRLMCKTCNIKQTKFDLYGDENYSNLEKVKATNLALYGVEFPLKRKDIRQKTIDTIKSKYNTDNVLKVKKFRDKAKATKKRLYGDECYTNLDKMRETNKKKYGVEYIGKSKAVRDKIEQTNLRKYGVKSTLSTKDVQEKRDKTMNDKYGASTTLQSPILKARVEETNEAKYGSISPFGSKEVQEKAKQTIKDRYGVEHIMLSEEIRDRVEETNLRKYGVKTTLLVPKVQEKIKQTMIDKYGVDHPMHHPDIIKHMQKVRGRKYSYDSENFDSSWELALWIYAKDHGEPIERVEEPLTYVVNGKTHYYFPDFKYKGELVEIKGSQFMNNGIMINPFDSSQNDAFFAKQQCAIDHGVKFMFNENVQFAIDYARNKFGGNSQWYNQFSINLIPDPVQLTPLPMMPMYIYPTIPMMLPWWMFMIPCDFNPYSMNVFEREGMKFVDCE